MPNYDNISKWAELSTLAVDPGDTIVVTVAFKISVEVAETIRAQVEKAFPGHRVLVMDGNLALAAVPDA